MLLFESVINCLDKKQGFLFDFLISGCNAVANTDSMQYDRFNRGIWNSQVRKSN